MSKRIRVEFRSDEPRLRDCITMALKSQGIRVSETRVRKEMATAYTMYGLAVLVDPEEYCQSNWELPDDWDIE